MHTGLGTVDDHAVAALGLPKSADGSKPDGVVPSSHQVEGAAKAAEVAAKAAEGEAQTFSMGVTLPTVPARLASDLCPVAAMLAYLLVRGKSAGPFQIH